MEKSHRAVIEALARVIEREGSQTAAAEALGVSQAMVSATLGGGRPGPKLAAALGFRQTEKRTIAYVREEERERE